MLSVDAVDREGYTEAQIVAVSSRYDVDGGRSIGCAELRKMQADLNRQKVSNPCLFI